MHVFISWSGPKSGAVARVLKTYLPSLINQVDPWLSSEQIDAGARWSKEIADNLQQANMGITCLTAENQHHPWILFEAGAVAKLTTVGRAMVLRIDLNNSDITGPLTQFQGVAMSEEGIWKILTSLNKATEPPLLEANLRRTFDALWPSMKKELDEAIAQDDQPPVAKRTSEEILEEVLDLVRSTGHGVQQIALQQKNAELRQSIMPTTMPTTFNSIGTPNYLPSTYGSDIITYGGLAPFGSPYYEGSQGSVFIKLPYPQIQYIVPSPAAEEKPVEPLAGTENPNKTDV